MATQQHTARNTEAAILSRLIHPERDDWSNEAAQALLRLAFDQEDLDRIHDLVTRNQADDLTPVERDELESYLRISSFLDLMHAKARRTVRKHS